MYNGGKRYLLYFTAVIVRACVISALAAVLQNILSNHRKKSH